MAPVICVGMWQNFFHWILKFLDDFLCKKKAANPYFTNRKFLPHSSKIEVMLIFKKFRQNDITLMLENGAKN